MRPVKNGFTIIESMMAVVVLAVASGSILLPFVSAQLLELESQRRTFALTLASELLSEILVNDYSDVLSIYDGYTEDAGQLKDSNGNILSGKIYQNLSRKVSCTEVVLAQGSNSDIPGVQGIIVNVKVYYRGDELVSLTGMKGSL